MAEKQLDLDQLPSEFECCFCTFKVLNLNTDSNSMNCVTNIFLTLI